MDSVAWLEVTEFMSKVSRDCCPNPHQLLPSSPHLPPAPSPTSRQQPKGGSSSSLGSSGGSLVLTTLGSEIEPADPLPLPDLNMSHSSSTCPPPLNDQQHLLPSSPTGLNSNSKFSLREGAGARRLARFRSHSAVQLLLVQACSEIYAQLHRSIPPSSLVRLLGAMEGVARHAMQVGGLSGEA